MTGLSHSDNSPQSATSPEALNLRQESIAPSLRPAPVVSPEIPDYYTEALSALEKRGELPPLAVEHIEKVQGGKFALSQNLRIAPGEGRVWYEGSFDPIGPHHLMILRDAMLLGFTRGVLAVVHQNPLKTNSTPFDHRVEMAKVMLRDAGIKIAENPWEDGVYIYQDEDALQHQKIRAWFDDRTVLLVGPDNFDSYLRNDVVWAHDPAIRNHPKAAQYFGFQSLYDNLIADRVLVYPKLYDYHATAIRKGIVEAPPVLQPYIAAHGLYPSAKAGPGVAQPIVDTGTLSPERTCPGDYVALISDISEIVGEHGWDAVRSRDSLNAVFESLDESQQLRLQKKLDQAVRAKKDEAPVSIHRDPMLREVRDAILDGLSTPEVQGINHVVDALRRDQRVVFYVEAASRDALALLPWALRRSGVAAVADSLTFVADTEPLKDEFELLFLRDGIVSSNSLNAKDLPSSIQAHVFLQHLFEEGVAAVLDLGEVEGVKPADFLTLLDPQILQNHKLRGEDVLVVPCKVSGSPTTQVKINFGAGITTDNLFEPS